MSDTDLHKDSEASQLMDDIRNTFSHVERGAGVTLHETRVIDMYGTDGDRAAARSKDTDRHWSEVQDEWIEEFDGVGGLSFMDEAGFRYYLPAYMEYFLRRKEEPNCLTFYLSKEEGIRDFENLFTQAQLRIIARFLCYVCREYDCLCPEIYERDWAHCTEGTAKDITNRATE